MTAAEGSKMGRGQRRYRRITTEMVKKGTIYRKTGIPLAQDFVPEVFCFFEMIFAEQMFFILRIGGFFAKFVFIRQENKKSCPCISGGYAVY